MKQINIYVNASYDYNTRTGCGMLIWEYNMTRKFHYEHSDETTCNRVIMNLVEFGLNKLKEPCKIFIYTQCSIGHKYLYKQKNWVNRDLGDKIVIAIKNGKHEVEFIDYSQVEEQQYLLVELKKLLYSWREKCTNILQ